MALSATMMQALCARLHMGDSVASMGYPDIVAPMEDVKRLLGTAFENLEYRVDSRAICKRHGLAERQIPDAESFFECLGVTLTVYDIVDERGCEILMDLNKPSDVNDRYDFVLDVGTLEHCFNIGQAALNMAGLLKLGGVILHENPFNWGNHGFYGLNPTWYADFYQQNGFKFLLCAMTTKDGRIAKVPPTGRFKFAQNEEFNVFAIAERAVIAPFCWPTQTKYMKLIHKEEEVANA